jgi:hypothetical protein
METSTLVIFAIAILIVAAIALYEFGSPDRGLPRGLFGTDGGADSEDREARDESDADDWRHRGHG